MPIVTFFRALVLLALIGVAVLATLAIGRRAPQDVPWGSLDLGDPVGRFTGAKLIALGGDPPLCRALLDRAGIGHVALPSRRAGPNCGYSDGVRAHPGGPLAIVYRPAIGARCGVIAALAVWEWNVVQPAAQDHFGSRVVAIEDYGTYSCRAIGGGRAGNGRSLSEHASANAVDIAGFRLANGRRVTIARDWTDAGPAGAFLHDVRDGACRLFGTTLSPDYNAAHRDHLHLDQASRGAGAWRACR